MKHHLKEKGKLKPSSIFSDLTVYPAGMQSFVQEYVSRRGIPIPQLLYAFDVVLVSLSAPGRLYTVEDIFQCSQLRNKHPKTMEFFLEVAMSRE
jgi:hypothetical protein